MVGIEAIGVARGTKGSENKDRESQVEKVASMYN